MAHGFTLWSAPDRVRRAANCQFCQFLSEIDGHHVLAETGAVLRDRHMLRVLLVGVQRRAVLEDHQQTRVVRASRTNDIFADDQIHDAIEMSEPAQSISVILTNRLGGVGFVLEANDMSEHLRGFSGPGRWA